MIRVAGKVIGLLFLVGAFCTWADKPKVNGFLSQAVIVSNDNPFYDSETGVNFNFHEFGLNTTWQAAKQIRIAGQVISRKAGRFSDSSPDLDFLLADYNFFLSENASSGIRLGRLRNPYGLYNATRDVPHARPGVFVPRSVYFESFREALQRIDGGSWYLSNNSRWGDFSVDVSMGKTKVETTAVEYILFEKDILGKFGDLNAVGLKFNYVPALMPDLTVAYTWFEFDTELQSAPTFSLPEQFAASLVLFNDPTQFSNYITGLRLDGEINLYSMQYNWDNWILTGEYLNIDIGLNDFEVLHQPFSESNTTLRGSYLQLEWLASQHWSAYSRYEEVYNNIDDKDGLEYALRTGGNQYTQYAKALTLGARYYLTPDWSITGEFSHNEGATFIAGADDIDYSALKKDWDLYIFQISFHF